jgi:hypothetical protein
MSIRRLICACLAAAAIGTAAVETSAAERHHVTISVQATLYGDMLRIRGTATVPDGALIIYAAYLAKAPRTRMVGFARVSGQRYAAEVDVSRWPAGKIAVDAHFQIRLPGRKQPADVIARYGANGERMTGPKVVHGGLGFRAAVVSTSVVRPR